MELFTRAFAGACRLLLALPLCLGLLAAAWGQTSQALGPAALRDKHLALAPRLANNQFHGPLYLESVEDTAQLEGDIYAVVDHPFAVVNAALSDPAHWCDILLLHLNNKYCRVTGQEGAAQLELRIGRKHDQPVAEASPVLFSFRTVAARPDYLDVELEAPEGPMDTRDYRMLLEAIPLTDGRSFIHMRYSFGYGRAGRLAMRLYLATVGRGKVGFTTTGGSAGGEPALIGGVRGLVERNTMRYYLAIEAYLDGLSAPPAQRLDKSLEAWFAGTEKYPRQLHEIERTAYLEMKRREYQRQTTQ
jgi:hypothetical protein